MTGAFNDVFTRRGEPPIAGATSVSSRKNGRSLHASCECCSLDERDAIIDALRPLVEQGWQIDLTYSFDHQLTPRRVTLGARVDVFDQTPASH